MRAMRDETISGPLADVRVVELAAIGPVPFCGMMLADLGARVVRIDRSMAGPMDRYAPENRGRTALALDLKSEAGRTRARDLIAGADIVIEGYRPGVMERLGLCPEVVLAANPALVYGRMTGWGQTGPYRDVAGHDINFIAVSGALHATGPAEHPVIPLNLVGDYGGGAMHLVAGVLAALHHARRTGRGQVVDCAMSDAAISLMSMIYQKRAEAEWRDSRASNVIDGGAHFYNVYRCRDGAWIAIGAIEARFYRLLREKLDLQGPLFDRQLDRSAWPALKARLSEIFAQRTRAEWCALLEGSDVCFAPVLSMDEAAEHPHNVARGAFVERDGRLTTAPVPRLSATPASIRPGAAVGPADTAEFLKDWAIQ
ncbi:CaiB/BaiF CoA transferase family protein [Microbaculum sp. FT89]|uniref:CaiB/BaiF CoA transferase family protein n=1 Tax=Microbaculum sp. FT89 TaxID=3447298 RepID=UPI003F53D920